MAKNILTVTVQQLDDNGEVMARRTFSTTETDADAGDWRNGYLPDTSATSISFTGIITTARQVLFRNPHATAKITVEWTPNGGSISTINKVGPGGTLILWDDTTAATTIGITALRLTSDTAGVNYELFIGGSA